MALTKITFADKVDGTGATTSTIYKNAMSVNGSLFNANIFLQRTITGSIYA